MCEDAAKLSAAIEVVRMTAQQSKEISAELREELKRHIGEEGHDVKELVKAIHRLDLNTQSLNDSVKTLVETVKKHDTRITNLERTKLIMHGGWVGVSLVVSVVWAAGIGIYKNFF